MSCRSMRQVANGALTAGQGAPSHAQSAYVIEQQTCVVFVPEGQPRVAHPFKGGIDVDRLLFLSPVGTAEGSAIRGTQPSLRDLKKGSRCVCPRTESPGLF
jgi:hypothetical protein